VYIYIVLIHADPQILSSILSTVYMMCMRLFFRMEV